jgi:hypothetical protein
MSDFQRQMLKEFNLADWFLEESLNFESDKVTNFTKRRPPRKSNSRWSFQNVHHTSLSTEGH